MPIAIQTADLAAPVAKMLDTPTIEIVDWTIQSLSGGTADTIAGGLGIYHLSGTARHETQSYPWSLVLKGAGGLAGTGSNKPDAWDYWKREALAYQSGLLDSLPGGLVPPRCYGVEERPEEIVWLWLEHIQASAEKWDMTRHGLAARHLGQFNGAYLAGYPLPPAEPWMSWGRSRLWTEFMEARAPHSRQYADTPLAQRWFGQDGLERTLRIWEQHRPLLQAFEQLPVCYCHHDASCRNLLARQRVDGSSETVAIDWGLTGFGRVGEEAGQMTAAALFWLKVPADQARELGKVVFAGYLDGLRDAGWRGDNKLARLGFTVNAFLLFGITMNLFHLQAMQQPAKVSEMETNTGQPVDAIIAQWAEILPFFLELGEEAYTLMQELG